MPEVEEEESWVAPEQLEAALSSARAAGVARMASPRAPDWLAKATEPGTGAVAAVLGGLYLVAESLEYRDPLCSIGCLLYAVALVGVVVATALLMGAASSP